MKGLECVTFSTYQLREWKILKLERESERLREDNKREREPVREVNFLDLGGAVW
jgi:hypothetical protein